MQTKHHRRPRRLGGLSIPSNISYVPDKQHAAWHLLFNHMEASDICDLINNIWLDPRYKFVCVDREPIAKQLDKSSKINGYAKPKKKDPASSRKKTTSKYHEKVRRRNLEDQESPREPINFDVMNRVAHIRSDHWSFTPKQTQR